MHRQHRYMHSHRKVDQSSSLGRLVPKILHDFQHLHGFPATLNFLGASTTKACSLPQDGSLIDAHVLLSRFLHI